MFEAALFGSFIVFWLSVVLIFGVVCVLIEYESSVGALLVLTGFVVLLHFQSSVALLDTLMNNISIVLVCLPVYFALGAVWSVFRFFMYVRRAAQEYREKTVSHYSSNFHFHKKGDRITILASAHKHKIMNWILFWPFSIVSWSLADLVRQIWISLSNLYQQVADYATRDLSQGI